MHADPAHVFHEDRSAADVAAGSLVPSQAELLAEYAEARRALGATVAEVEAATTGLAWFLGVCHYKMASTIAVIYKRDRKRPDPDPKLATAARHLDAVLEAGHRGARRGVAWAWEFHRLTGETDGSGTKFRAITRSFTT